jgi:hypothetical protein
MATPALLATAVVVATVCLVASAVVLAGARARTSQTSFAVLATMMQRAQDVRQRAEDAVRAVRERGTYSPQQLRAPPTPTPSFPVDAVFTWVDGTDAAWRADVAQARRRDVHSGTFHPACRDPFFAASARRTRRVRDELFYSAQLARAHLPWLRTIFIVTQRPQRPWWLEHDDAVARNADSSTPGPRLVVVHHDSFFGPDVTQPTFNSLVIESQLARLPKLAEHFVLFNDDVFVGQPLPRSAFFADDGTPVVRMRGREASCRNHAYHFTWAQNLLNLHSVCDVVGVPLHLPAHVSLPLRKSVLHAVTAVLAPLVRALRQTRTPWDFPLVYLAASATPWRALPPHIDTVYYSSGDRFAADVKARGDGALPHLFCINENFYTKRAHAVLRRALEAAT